MINNQRVIKLRVYNIIMGNFCQACLKQNVKEPEFRTQQQGTSLTELYPRKQNNQMLASNVVLSIQPSTNHDIEADSFFIFVDHPEAVLKNPFVAKMGISPKNNLKQKIQAAQKRQQDRQSSTFCLKINQPFYDIPVRKLIITGIKVWDGTSNQKNYLKSTIEKALGGEVKVNGKKSYAIAEIDSNLGYNSADFERILVKQLNQMASAGKLNHVTYLVNKNNEALQLRQSDPSIRVSSESSAEQRSNYY